MIHRRMTLREPGLITVLETVRVYGLSKSTVLRRIKAAGIEPAQTFGKGWHLYRAEDMRRALRVEAMQPRTVATFRRAATLAEADAMGATRRGDRHP